MKKILYSLLIITVALCFMGCGKSETAKQAMKVADAETITDKLDEIDGWLISDIWNKGFVDIRDYIANGTSSTGETLDIDFTIESLDIAIKKKSDYDSFIDRLEGEKYTQIKSIWERLSPEIDTLYNQVKKTPPVANDVNNSLDTGKFVQYRDVFTDVIYDLD
ncbi:MAG: hypothetical protein PHE03_10320 [Bacteroidales bacterium]|nr:hypothetical protein [Bacteroidales bacterium]